MVGRLTRPVEGDTLVVETVNFRAKTSLQGSTADTRVWNASRESTTIDQVRFTVSDPNCVHPTVERHDALSESRANLRVRLHEGNYAADEHSRCATCEGEGDGRHRPLVTFHLVSRQKARHCALRLDRPAPK